MPHQPLFALTSQLMGCGTGTQFAVALFAATLGKVNTSVLQDADGKGVVISRAMASSICQSSMLPVNIHSPGIPPDHHWQLGWLIIALKGLVCSKSL